jgi:hypothetical protein
VLGVGRGEGDEGCKGGGERIGWPRTALSEARLPPVHGSVDTIIPAQYDHSIICLATPVTHLPPSAFYK